MSGWRAALIRFCHRLSGRELVRKFPRVPRQNRRRMWHQYLKFWKAPDPRANTTMSRLVREEGMYRAALQKLFVRQWLLADLQSFESYASPAYETSAEAETNLAHLKPQGTVRFQSQIRPGQPGYRFEVDIPYSSFPPLNTLEVSDLRLMVNVFSAAPAGQTEGAYSSSASAGAYGKPETFNRLRLDPPITFETSPCDSTLASEKFVNDLGISEKSPAWFIPSGAAGNYQSDAFLVGNWTPYTSILDDLFSFHYFWRALGPDEWVCGPDLAYRKGETVRDLGFSTALVSGNDDLADTGFDAKKAPNGTLLIKVGPRVWVGGGLGQCGACPVVDFRMLGVDPNLNLITLLQLGDRIGDPNSPVNEEFSLSPDWSRVTEYDASSESEWSSVTYCLEGDHYRQCAQTKDVRPPGPSLLPFP